MRTRHTLEGVGVRMCLRASEVKNKSVRTKTESNIMSVKEQLDHLEATHQHIALSIADFTELLSKVRLRRGQHVDGEAPEANGRASRCLIRSLDILRELKAEIAECQSTSFSRGQSESGVAALLAILNVSVASNYGDKVKADFTEVHTEVNNMLVEGAL